MGSTVLRVVLLTLLVASPGYCDLRQAIGRYAGWRVMRVVAGQDDKEHLIHDLHNLEHPDDLQVLHVSAVEDAVDVAVSPTFLTNMTEVLSGRAVATTIEHDLGGRLGQGPVLRETPLAPGTDTFERYMSLDEIRSRVEALPKLYPGKAVLEVIGYSSEGRPIHLVTVTDESKSKKPVIVVDGGMHAREWASPASALYLLNRLLESPDTTSGVEWRIFPLLNPDGYHYSWTHDRMWRKNRRNLRAYCDGVDLNRNFDYHWGEAGTSNSECSSIFRGPRPFSEPETKALRKVIKDAKRRTKAYVSIHAYGQYLLHPWGYSGKVLPDNVDQLVEVGSGMAEEIRAATGAVYSVGSAAGMLYPAAGASDDWAASQGIPLSYTLELRDQGQNGFILPPSQIQYAAQDVWAAMKYLGRQVQQMARMEALEETLHVRAEQEGTVAGGIEVVASVPEIQSHLPAIHSVHDSSEEDSSSEEDGNSDEIVAWF